MPELPEVETIRRGLEPVLVGRKIANVEVRAPKLFEGKPAQVVGHEITAVRRNGKLLVLDLAGDNLLTIHLKMTGQLIWLGSGDRSVMGGHPEKAYLETLPHKHTHIIIKLDDGSTLYFNDLRKFGRMSVVAKKDFDSLAFIGKLGPEPLEPVFTSEYLAERLAKHPKQPLKSFLLDQTNIAGLGNIYADESLFRAAILPYRTCSDLSSEEIVALYKAIKETLEVALEHGGSSSKDYLTAVGERGTFLAVANVYHRTGLACNRCHIGVIERMKIGGRSTHFCPICQK